MVMTSEFIVVRTGVEMLIWSDNRSVHAFVWLIFLFFSDKPLARLLLVHEKGPELRLGGYSKAHMMQCRGRCAKLHMGSAGRML